MKRLQNVTIGADPELFIVNEKTGKVVSSIGLIPGEKGNAYTEGMPDGFGLQIDNILAEFNVPPIQLSEMSRFSNNINYAKDYIDKYVKSKNPDLGILCKASMFVDEDQLQSDEAQAFGCSPDYNAYTMSENEKPEGDKTNLRTTGCHIHVGYRNPDADTSILLVKYMDATLGLVSLFYDEDTERRKLYGKAGCFRLTPYGVEYRVLSGYFINNDDILRVLTSLILFAIKAYNNGFHLPKEDSVAKAINTGNKELAKKLLCAYQGFVPYIDKIILGDNNIVNTEYQEEEAQAQAQIRAGVELRDSLWDAIRSSNTYYEPVTT